MPILTDQILVFGLSLSDLVHIARPTDDSQSVNGSSYKATIGQLIDSESCCLSSGLYTASTGTINFYGLSNQLQFSVTGITFFSGGSGSCINDFYNSNIFPCSENILIQPEGLNGQTTYIGKTLAKSGLTINHVIDNDGLNTPGPNKIFTKLGLNVDISINVDSSVELFSYNKKTSFRYYDNFTQSNPGLFANFQEVILISYFNNISTSVVVQSGNECGIILGAISGNENQNTDYGAPNESFISTIYSANGINIISDSLTGLGGYIRFYAGCAPDTIDCNNKPHIHINGSGTTKGFIGVGQDNLYPTSLLDIFSGSSFQYEQFRIRTPYTLTGQKDPNGEIGEFAWDDDYLYIKIDNVLAGNNWFRIALSTF